MKSTIYGHSFERKYSLGQKAFGWATLLSNEESFENLSTYSNEGVKGKVYSKKVFMEYKKLEETSKFNRELDVSELVKIGEIEYNILKKSYETNGDINYYINYEEIIEDLDSKNEAEKNLELRMSYLKGKEYVSVKEESTTFYGRTLDGDLTGSVSTINKYGWRQTITDSIKPKTKKWYEIWK